MSAPNRVSALHMLAALRKLELDVAEGAARTAAAELERARSALDDASRIKEATETAWRQALVTAGPVSSVAVSWSTALMASDRSQNEQVRVVEAKDAEAGACRRRLQLASSRLDLAMDAASTARRQAMRQSDERSALEATDRHLWRGTRIW